jgi:hypothetical protein
MIIFVNILLDKGIISNEAFTAALLMAAASTMLSIPMVAPKLRRIDRVGASPSTNSAEVGSDRPRRRRAACNYFTGSDGRGQKSGSPL